MKTTFECLMAVARIGGKLGIADGDGLRTLLPPDCPPGLKDALRVHRPALLTLLRSNFLVVRAEALNAIVVWSPDEATKDLLISKGADRGSIYTPSELEQIVHRRVTVGELTLIHAAKQRFSGRVAEP